MATTPAEATTFDYIIVGGGIGGCVLANRLTESGRAKVLLLEAGKPSDYHPYVQIPAGSARLFNGPLDWKFESAPEQKLDGKEVYLIRGKTLGGSSALNVMLVHRGTASDYAKWEQAGAEGWGPEEVLKYFKKAEDNSGGASAYHGVGGNYPVDDVRYQNPLSQRFLEACKGMGWAENADFNDWSRPQVGYGRFKVTQRKGQRVSAASGYLPGAVRSRPNLVMATEAYVTRVLLDGDRATGVEFCLGGEEEARVARIGGEGEVLLAGGAIQSPHLLMLSGIGPAEELKAVGVAPKIDRPGVGSNLQDHPAVVVAHDITQPIAWTDDIFMTKELVKPLNYVKWGAFGRGPLVSPGCDHGAFVKTEAKLPEADLQVRFVAGRGQDPDGVRAYIHAGDKGRPLSGLTVQVVGVRAQSKGKLSLASKDPRKAPRIECRYLSEAADLKTLRSGLRLARELVKQPAFADVLGPEIFPGPEVKTDAELDAYIRESLHTANALVGTCRMGRADDKGAVVDPSLRVIGTKNLRVVDASVMPFIPGGQTGAPTTMIAERGADLIRAAHGDLTEAAN